MKYIRKITALVLAIIFCAAIIIGLGIIFSVKNVNVQFIDSTGAHAEEFARTRDNLNKLKGSGMVFLSDSDISDKVSDKSVLTVESYERIYPCTVNVVVKERIECFTVSSDGAINVYDEDGEFMRSERANGTYLNPTDNSPDIEIGGESVLSDGQYKCVGDILKSFKSHFGSLRKAIEKVTVYQSVASVDIKLRSGVSVLVYEWENDADTKINAAYNCYKNLSDGQRISGMIAVGTLAEGKQPVAEYRSAT